MAALVASALACVLVLVAAAPAGAAVVRPFEGSFGSFENVQAVAVDQASGDVFVYDNTGSGLVYKFDASGKPLKFTGGAEEKDAIGEVGSIGYGGVQELAISQAGETKGDLYAVNGSSVGIFDSVTGEKLGELNPGAACGVAVDPAGHVYVATEAGVVDRYAPKGKVAEASDLTSSLSGLAGGQSCQVAVDAAENTYVLYYSTGEVTRWPISEYNSSGEPAKPGTVIVPEEPSSLGNAREANTLAVDPASGHLFMDRQSGIAEFDSTGKALITFAGTGEEPVALSHGLAVAENGKAYVADDSRNRVDIFAAATEIPEPRVTIEPATNAESGEPVFHGTVNPEGHDTHWRFEYSLDGGKTWLTTPEQDAGTGTTPVSVKASGGDLHGQKIVVRLEAGNDGGSTTSTTVELETPARKCPNEQIREEQHSTYLPDCRAFEQVSPVEKNGGDVMPNSTHTRAAVDGEAVSFASLTGFGDVHGTGVAAEYLAERQAGTGRWVTHAITPAVPAATLAGVPYPALSYQGSLAPDLGVGVVVSQRPVTSDPYVEGVGNLYLRTDLRSTGPGSYTLLTACPKCGAEGKALPALLNNEPSQNAFAPWLAGTSADFRHVAFESPETLTGDAPAQLSTCADQNFEGEFSFQFCSPRLYEWEGGVVRLAGVLPGGEPADASFAGTGAYNSTYTSHAVSDGSDGHSRIVFTQPTDNEGKTVSELGPLGPRTLLHHGDIQTTGKLFMRIDHARTVMLDESERTTPGPDGFAPAEFLDASSNGERVFFTTRQALTNDAAPNESHIYMYDASKPPSAADNLSLVATRTGELLGVSGDGHYAYIAKDGGSIEVWHDGVSTTVAKAAVGGGRPSDVDGTNHDYFSDLREARVTADGRFLLFVSGGSPDLPPYDHGHCQNNGPCAELYVYSVEEHAVMCVSCVPSGAAATVEPRDEANEFSGGAAVNQYLDRALSDDGRFVFFSTAEALVPQDVNEVSDAYVFDTRTRTVSLLSSGKDPSPSFFLDASADGRDVFIATRERAVASDTDELVDVYDVRVDGGFPNEPPAVAPCAGSDCRTAAVPGPVLLAPPTATQSGGGNVNPVPAGKAHVPSRSQRLRAALRACRHKKLAHRRRRCEASARWRSGRVARTGGSGR